MDIIFWLAIAILLAVVSFSWQKRTEHAMKETQALYDRMTRLEELAYHDAEQLKFMQETLDYRDNRITELVNDFVEADSTIENIRRIIVDNKLQGRAHFKHIYAFTEGYREKDEDDKQA